MINNVLINATDIYIINNIVFNIAKKTNMCYIKILNNVLMIANNILLYNLIMIMFAVIFVHIIQINKIKYVKINVNYHILLINKIQIIYALYANKIKQQIEVFMQNNIKSVFLLKNVII